MKRKQLAELEKMNAEYEAEENELLTELIEVHKANSNGKHFVFTLISKF